MSSVFTHLPFRFFPADHVSFIKEVAATQPPKHLNNLLRMLKVRGKVILFVLLLLLYQLYLKHLWYQFFFYLNYFC